MHNKVYDYVYHYVFKQVYEVNIEYKVGVDVITTIIMYKGRVQMNKMNRYRNAEVYYLDELKGHYSVY